MFIASAILVFKGFFYYETFLELPLSLEILILLGFVTPVLNLYDTTRNMVTLGTLLSQGETDEDNL